MPRKNRWPKKTIWIRLAVETLNIIQQIADRNVRTISNQIEYFLQQSLAKPNDIDNLREIIAFLMSVSNYNLDTINSLSESTTRGNIISLKNEATRLLKVLKEDK